MFALAVCADDAILLQTTPVRSHPISFRSLEQV